MSEEHQSEAAPSKLEWVTPKARRMSAGSAEFAASDGGDAESGVS